MKITWLGHACFLLETKSGIKIVTDPYEPGSYGGAVGYGPINVDADIVTVSHGHADHNYTRDFTKARIIDSAGPVSLEGLEISGIATYHDNESGRARGKNIIFLIKADGLSVAHFGDLGTLDFDASGLRDIDVALVPVGGTFTIGGRDAGLLADRLKPKIVIPMHFKTPKLKFDIAGADDFLAGKTNVDKKQTLEISPENIGSFKKIVVLDYQR